MAVLYAVCVCHMKFLRSVRCAYQNPPRPAAACQTTLTVMRFLRSFLNSLNSLTVLRFLRSFLNSLNSIKLIEPRARRASPQGHGKSLPDAVKNIDFPSVLEGFRPNPSNRLRPRRASLIPCKNSNSILCDTVQKLKVRYCGTI